MSVKGVCASDNLRECSGNVTCGGRCSWGGGRGRNTGDSGHWLQRRAAGHRAASV